MYNESAENVVDPLAANAEPNQTNSDVSGNSSTAEDNVQLEGASGNSPSAEEDKQPETSLEAVEEALGIEDPETGDREPEAEARQPDSSEDPAKEETDEDLYRMPDDVKSDKARDRFHKLVDSNKEWKEKAEVLSDRVEAVQRAFAESKCEGEEIAGLLDFGRMVKSNDPKDLEQAWTLVQAMRQKLAITLGKVEAGADVLPPHLQERVNAYELTHEDALALARAELANQAQARVQEQSNLADQQQRDFDAKLKQANRDITALEARWKSEDPDYAQKRDYILSKVPEIQQRYQPEQWHVVINDIYEAISGPSMAGNKQTKRPNSLRPSSIAANSKNFKSSEEAVLDTLGIS